SPEQRIARDLARARHLLSRSDGDDEEALGLARDALETVTDFDGHIGEAAFLVGTAYMRMAEKSDPSAAPQSWRRARPYLQQPLPAGAPDEDQLRLTYRLGKVGLFTGDSLDNVIARLDEATPRGDNRAEGYDLLTRAHLLRRPPDLVKALKYNKELRNVPEATEDELNAAKLLGGDLLLRLGRPEEARKTLEKIPEQAPANILVRARLLRAHSYQDEKLWGDAVRLYQTILGDKRFPVPDPSRVYYDLGLCYRRLDQPQDAVAAW